MAQVIDCEVKFNLPRVELEIKNAERNLKIKEDEIIKLKADIGKLRLQLALYGDQGAKGTKPKTKPEKQKKKSKCKEEATKLDKSNENAAYEEIENNVYITPPEKSKVEETDCECKSECGNNCLNRAAQIECGSNCPAGDSCTNRCFQNREYAPCVTFETDKKGKGLKATADIPERTFIGEYVGEGMNEEELAKREQEYSKSGKKECYVMLVERSFYIDATKKGNKFRFINHSCDPNAKTEKRCVNGETRIGFYSIKSIKSGEEITFDYQFKRNGGEPQTCYCESTNCRGRIGDKPISDEKIELEGDKEENMLPDDRVQPAEKCQHKNIRHGKCKDCNIDVEICDRDCKKDHDCKRPNMSVGKCLECGMRPQGCNC